MSDEHPVEEPGPAAPAWVALPTMPWTRVVPTPRHGADAGVSAAVPPPGAEPDPDDDGREPERGGLSGWRRRRARHARSKNDDDGWTPIPPEAPSVFDEPPPRSRPFDQPAFDAPPQPPPALDAARESVVAFEPAPAPASARYPQRPVPESAPRYDDPTPPGGVPVLAAPTSAPPASAPPTSAFLPTSAPPASAFLPTSAPPANSFQPPQRIDEPARETRPEPPPVEREEPAPASPPVREEPHPPPPAPEEPPPPDPEQILSGYEWRFDPDTLHEIVEGEEVGELGEIRDLLTSKLNGVADNATRARLLSLRAVVSRILGDLNKALADGRLAVAHADATGELRRVAIAQARLAHVHQWRGEYGEADRLFTLANSTELPDRLRATMHQHSGRSSYDQGRYIEACNHFEMALQLRRAEDPDLIAQTELALDAVFRRVAEKGWGPYPRTRDEILKIHKSPTPAFDEHAGRWGYLDESDRFCIGPGYVDVQPFRDGVAWVQRPGSHTWELIDDTGDLLIPPGAGYLGVGSFSDGLAWVSHDGTTRWIAIDKSNKVLISTGFDDVRPFRRGAAAVRRNGRWGAVDGVGRVVVPFQFDGFATALHDGRYIDGFSDEGLAVVALRGRKGVVDRSGRLIVPPVHPVLVIHPVAFLIVDGSGRWGALDRQGRLLIEPTFGSRTGVTDEIDRLLADTRPML